MSLRSSDHRPGTLSLVSPGLPLVSDFASRPFHTLLLCLTMGMALAICQVSGTPAEQEWRAYALPFFLLASALFFS